MNNCIEWVRFGFSALFTLLGLFVLLSGVIGLFRFKYSLSRVHAGALFDTVGILFMSLGVIVALGFTLTSFKILVVIAFLWLTSPVCSHLIGNLETTIDDNIDEHLEILDKDLVKHIKEGK